jgi:hypothetical protein
MAFSGEKNFEVADVFDDVKIIAKDNYLYTSRSYLGKIPYFKKMLTSGFKESKPVNGFYEIDIKDFDSYVIKHILKAIHENSNIYHDTYFLGIINTIDIFIFADKYGIETKEIEYSLKSDIESMIKSVLLYYQTDIKVLCEKNVRALLDVSTKLQKYQRFDVSILMCHMTLMYILMTYNGHAFMDIIEYFIEINFEKVIKEIYADIEKHTQNGLLLLLNNGGKYHFMKLEISKRVLCFCYHLFHAITQTPINDTLRSIKNDNIRSIKQMANCYKNYKLDDYSILLKMINDVEEKKFETD